MSENTNILDKVSPFSWKQGKLIIKKYWINAFFIVMIIIYIGFSLSLEQFSWKEQIVNISGMVVGTLIGVQVSCLIQTDEIKEKVKEEIEEETGLDVSISKRDIEQAAKEAAKEAAENVE